MQCIGTDAKPVIRLVSGCVRCTVSVKQHWQRQVVKPAFH